MAEILVKGGSREPRQDELRIEFPSSPSFRSNHNILTPSVIGTIRGYDQPMFGFLPCPDEEAALLLANTTVTLRRLARFERDNWYGDVRDDDEFWPAMPPSYRPNVNAKAYDLPHGGPNTDAATIRTLIVKDFTRTAYDLIADFEEQQNAELEDLDKQLASFGIENPIAQAQRLSDSLGQIIMENPSLMLESFAETDPNFDRVYGAIRLLNHLQKMPPINQRQALILPTPGDTWRFVGAHMRDSSKPSYPQSSGSGVGSAAG